MKVFVTGVAGFLGSHLADAMIADGHHVVGVDNLIGGELDNVPSKVDFHQFDCNDFNHIQKVSEACDIFIIAPRRPMRACRCSRPTS